MDLSSLSTFGKRFRRTRLPGGEVFDPVHDWVMLLAAAAIVIALFLAVGIYLFLDIGDLSYESPPEPVVETLDRAALERVLGDFVEKDRSFEALRRAPTRLVDPAR